MRVDRRAILILGMHRSGTSVVSRLVNLLGAELGDDLLPPTTDNSKGYWEHRGVVAIHERLLAALGRSWYDVRALPDGWLSSEPAREAANALAEVIQRDFDQVPLWAVKDPRLCRLVPLWRQVLRSLSIDVAAIFVLRSPEEVARSIQVRDGLPLAESRVSWTQHLAEAELATRDIPRCMVAYDSVMRQWQSSVVQVADALAMSWPIAPEQIVSQVANFIDPSIRHHRLAVELSGQTILAEIYAASRALADGNGAWADLGRLIDNYLAVAPLFTDCLEVLGMDLANTQHQRLELASAQRREEGLRYLLQSENLNKVFSEEQPFADYAKTYFRRADGTYGEGASQIEHHDGLLTRTDLRFELPGVALDFLRLDPSEFPGTFDIREIRINGKAFDVTFQNIGAFNSRIADRVGLTQVALSSDDGDPFVEIDVRARLDAGDPVYLVEWSCRRCQTLDRLESLIESNINAALDGLGTVLLTVQGDRNRIIGSLADVNSAQSQIAEVQLGMINKLDALAGQVMQNSKGLAQAAEVQVGLSSKLDALAGQVKLDFETNAERALQFNGDLKEISSTQAELGKVNASKMEVLERNVALILENSERSIFRSIRRLVSRK